MSIVFEFFANLKRKMIKIILQAFRAELLVVEGISEPETTRGFDFVDFHMSTSKKNLPVCEWFRKRAFQTQKSNKSKM